MCVASKAVPRRHVMFPGNEMFNLWVDQSFWDRVGEEGWRGGIGEAEVERGGDGGMKGGW